MSINDWDETRLEAMWAWNSETGEKVLIDLKTGQVIGTWIKTEQEASGN